MKMHELIALAKLGAPARLRQLQEEMAALQSFVGTGAVESPRRQMTPAARRAVSDRMRKYWAGRRKQKK